MVTIHVKNIEGKTVLPVHGSELAAGYDIVAVDDPVIVGETVMKEGEFFPFYRRIDYLEYHTALHIAPQSGGQFQHHNPDTYHTLIHPRSSVRKYNLLLANSIGLIDNDYRGELLVCFKYVWQPEDLSMEMQKMALSDGGDDYTWTPTGKFLGQINRNKIYKKGDLIGQLVAEKTNPMEFVFVSTLEQTVRGEGGHGSTGTTLSDHQQMKIEVKEVKKVEKPSSSMYPEGVFQRAVQDYEQKNVGGPIVERYQKAGGIPIKKRYSEEVKERQAQESTAQ